MPLLLEEDLKRPLPKMYRVRQSFNKEHLEDIEGTVAREFAKAEIRSQVKPGMRVALAVGSRGIRNLSRIVKCVVDQLLMLGAEPFIVAAMGSHGGGTLEGQLEILHTYGITQEAMGIPVVANNDVELLGSTSRGIQVYFDKLCLEQADLVIPINRVKTHTSFKGCVESGLCKKLVVGLGGPGGAGQFHSLGQAELPRLLVEVTKVLLGKMPVLGGVAIVENAYEESRRFPPRRSSRKKSGCWRGRSRSCPPCPRTGCTASSWRKWGRISAEPESTPISSDGCALRANRKWKARASGTFRYWTFRKPRTATLRAWALWTS